MSKPESRSFYPPGWPIAKGLDVLSGMVLKSEAFTRKFMKSKAESHEPIRWQAANQSAHTISSWAVFDPNPDAGLLAGSYSRVGLVGVRKRPFEQLMRAATELDSTTRVAVAYRFVGRSVMVGVLPEGISLVEHPEHPDMLVIGMGMGRGGLEATVGPWNSKYRHIHVTSDLDVENRGDYNARHFPPVIPEI